MDIVCPNCAAAYRVPDSLLAGGKPLRCAACGHEWVPNAAAQAPPTPESPPPAAAQPEAEPAKAPPELPSERPPLVVHDMRPPVSQHGQRMERPLALSWVASVSIVSVALAAMAFYRHEIAAAWPPFARIVALLGG